MELLPAKLLALRLMNKHGLTEAGWRFEWMDSKRALGQAAIVGGRKFIRLSRFLIFRNSEEETKDTILHEIDHALAGLHNGHNRIWKQVCRRIGAKPQRLAGPDVETGGKYRLICLCCKRTLGTRHTLIPAYKLAGKYCRKCGPSAQGKLRLVENRPNLPECD